MTRGLWFCTIVCGMAWPSSIVMIILLFTWQKTGICMIRSRNWHIVDLVFHLQLLETAGSPCCLLLWDDDRTILHVLQHDGNVHLVSGH